jgi:two-component system chemotaxis response regulator CheB
VVVGGSAGALGPLKTILSTLPAELEAAVLVALHTTRSGPGLMADILGRATTLHVAFPIGVETLRNGHVYVAPPDHHLQVIAQCVETTREALEHYTRPSVDVLFRSAAQEYGSNVIAILLSGLGGDGSAGLVAVHAHNGVVIVQAPSDATFDTMPRRALDVVAAEFVLPAAAISDEVQRVLAGRGGTALRNVG